MDLSICSIKNTDTQDDSVICPTVHNIFHENMFRNIEKII